MKGSDYRSLPLFLLAAFLPSAGGFFTDTGSWYGNLVKPPFQPPPWLFGPVWTVLYLTIGVALWWYHRSGRTSRRLWTVIAVHLVLNFLWTPLFFGLHSPGLALLDMGLLLVTYAWIVAGMRPVSPRAAYLLVPYGLWLGFASVLNASIVWLNP
jgi:tryptophan-rich sensory protein